MVLVVDDEPETLLGLRSLLEKAGYAVVLAADADTARRRLAQRPPDVVLLDPAMPASDGWDLLRTGRLGAGVPVIVVSRASGDGDVGRARVAGAVAYLPKPLDIDRVLATVADTVGAAGAPRSHR